MAPGHFEGKVFIHEGLGLRIPFPSDWTILSEEQQEREAEAGRRFLSQGDPTGSAYRQNGPSTSLTLFAVYQNPPGTTPGVNPHLNGAVENVLMRPQIQTPVDYLEMLMGFLQRGGAPMTFEPIVPEVLVGGKVFAVMAVTVQNGLDRMGQIYYCRRFGDTILTLVATFATPDQWSQLEGIIQSIEFSA